MILAESCSLSRVIPVTNVISGMANQPGFCLAVRRNLGHNKGDIPPTCGTGNCWSLSFGATLLSWEYLVPWTQIWAWDLSWFFKEDNVTAGLCAFALNDLEWNSAMLDFTQLALPIFWTVFPVLDLVSVGLGTDVTVFGLSCVWGESFLRTLMMIGWGKIHKKNKPKGREGKPSLVT